MLQPSFALSTKEAEYMTTIECVKEVIWLNNLMEELSITDDKVELHCDNQSTIHFAKNQMLHARTMHIDVTSQTLGDH